MILRHFVTSGDKPRSSVVLLRRFNVGLAQALERTAEVLLLGMAVHDQSRCRHQTFPVACARSAGPKTRVTTMGGAKVNLRCFQQLANARLRASVTGPCRSAGRKVEISSKNVSFQSPPDNLDIADFGFAGTGIARCSPCRPDSGENRAS